MSQLAPHSVQDRRPAATLALQFSSNNPFRRAVSPNALSPATPPLQTQQRTRVQNVSPQHSQTQRPEASNNSRTVSTNPFLDNYQPVEPPPAYEVLTHSPNKMAASPGRLPRKPAAQVSTTQLMNNLTLTDQSSSDRNIQSSVSTSRLVNSSVNPLRPQKAQDEQPRGVDDKRARNIFDDEIIFGPPIRTAENRRPQRRNSDTSVIDLKDEERKRAEDGGRNRDPSSKEVRLRDHRSARSRRPNRKLDIIDRLDVTGVFGQGLFHHDGPFDACNPHRNRKGRKATPMQAFPEGSANNSLGGAGPVNRNIDLDKFHGRGIDSFNDYNMINHGGHERKRSQADQVTTFDPKSSAEPVHGEQTAGLGTSTFFEGTPAPRSALQGRDSDETARPSAANGGDLRRKKSIAKKLRGISRPRPGAARENDYATSPEPQYVYEERGSTSPRSPHGAVQSAGGRIRMDEVNPFFSQAVNPNKDADKETKPSAQVIEIAAGQSRQNRSRTLSSANGQASNGTGSGLINRVRSLKGRKPRFDKVDP